MQPDNPEPYQDNPYAPYPIGPPVPQQPNQTQGWSHNPPQVVFVQNNTRETSTLATMSLIFAILGVIGGCCTFGVFSIVAVILAHLAWKETKSGQKGGHGMTVTGLVLGYLMLIPAIFMSVSFILNGAAGVTPTS